MILLCEDEAVQKMWKSEFDIQVSSVGVLLSHYFLEMERNVEAFLDILIQVVKLKSAWKLQRNTLERIYVAVISSSAPVVMDKFNNWYNLYEEYFSVSNS